MLEADAGEAFIAKGCVNQRCPGFVGAFRYFPNQRRILKDPTYKQTLAFSQVESNMYDDIGIFAE
jgi:hypothetical protein